PVAVGCAPVGPFGGDAEDRAVGALEDNPALLTGMSPVQAGPTRRRLASEPTGSTRRSWRRGPPPAPDIRNNRLHFLPHPPTLPGKYQRDPPDETPRLADRHPPELPPPSGAEGLLCLSSGSRRLCHHRRRRRGP